MDSKTMLKTKLKKGYWFKNKAKLGKKPDWIIVKKPYEEDLLNGVKK